MSAGRERYEFSAGQVADLLSLLDRRLQHRGVPASVFVVGGAAVAASGVRGGRLTEDVDAIAQEPAVLEEARALAEERGLPQNWLNPNAGMWMPPLPEGVLLQPSRPGLRVTYADAGFLFRHQTDRPAPRMQTMSSRSRSDSVCRPPEPASLRHISAATTPTERPWSSSSMATTSTGSCASWLRTPQVYSDGGAVPPLQLHVRRP